MTEILVPLLLAAAATYGFDKDRPGGLPAGWETAMSKGDPAGEWAVVQDGAGRVLSYTVKKPHEAFGVALPKQGSFKDGAVQVKIKAVGGKYQAAGVVWRYKDAGNYYVARIEVGDKKVHVFKVVNGLRTSVGGKEVPSLASNQRQTPKVEHRGPAITVFVGGAKVFGAEDTALPEGGRVGVWFKDDSIVQFDDLDARELAK